MKRPVDKLLDDVGFRIVVDHAYHRLDQHRVWNTLCDDIPRLRAAIDRYRGRTRSALTGSVAGVGERWFNAVLGSARRCWWPAFVCANTST
jgi:hypothetical protein